jgi:hypothetical protein
MPALINSSPSCVVEREGATPADDSADFILQARYEDCAGFMTFGPGSTYGDEGAAAETAYYILTWLGIVVMVAVLVAWVVYENRRLVGHAARIGARVAGVPPEPPAPPQPGVTRPEE